MEYENKQNILVVDDEPHIVNLVKLSLTDDRFHVEGAYSAREALIKLGKFTPDLIILDIMMPGTNGYDLCRELKERDDTKEIPVVILSARNQINDKIQAVEVGADDYITKPFDPSELKRRVELNAFVKIKGGV
ncbi:MAG: response regulator transcription factor [Nanoarchaeota archaeon]